MPRGAAHTSSAAAVPQRSRRGISTAGDNNGEARMAAKPDALPNSTTVACRETLLEEAPHVGREAEYETVIAFVASRWSRRANTTLFVSGGCGCGKTSTVKRALRAVSRRVLPCDATGRSLIKRSSLEERGWQSATADASDRIPLSADKSGTQSKQNSVPAPGSPASTPRTSERLSSNTPAGLTPASPSLASVMSQNASAQSMPLSDADCGVARGEGEAVELWAGETLFSTTTPFSSHSTTPAASGRPSVNSEDSTSSTLAAAAKPLSASHKRGRDTAPATCRDGVDTAPRRLRRGEEHSAMDAQASSATPAATPFSLEYYQELYPEVFPSATRSSSSGGYAARGLFAHYVNCADLSRTQLIEAICESVQATCTRGDHTTPHLLQQLSLLSKRKVSELLPVASLTDESHKAPLHVVALDEVEHLGGDGDKTLKQLALLSYHLHGQLALIFISNERVSLDVPQTILELLLFEPYGEEQLKAIGVRATVAELERCERLACGNPTPVSKATRYKAAADASRHVAVRASDVDIKPRLYDYIARKALHDHMGDVRQVVAMCHSVVSLAWQEVTAEALKKRTAASAAAASAPDLTAKLEEAVTSFRGEAAGGTRRRSAGSSTSRSSAASLSSTRTSGSTTGAAAAPSPDSTATSAKATATLPSNSSGVMTLPKIVPVLQSGSVECKIDDLIGKWPEDTLYVLSCIVVLTTHEKERQQFASTSVGGCVRTTRVHGAGASTAAARRASGASPLRLHVVCQLYARLMFSRCMPAIGQEQLRQHVDTLADHLVLTRPSQRDSQASFSLQGTWSVQAIRAALVRRGEAIAADASFADAARRNKYEEILSELAKLVKT